MRYTDDQFRLASLAVQLANGKEPNREDFILAERVMMLSKNFIWEQEREPHISAEEIQHKMGWKKKENLHKWWRRAAPKLSKYPIVTGYRNQDSVYGLYELFDLAGLDEKEGLSVGVMIALTTARQ